MASKIIRDLSSLLTLRSQSPFGISHLRLFSTTGILNAEPLRKKRRLDPLVLKTRVEKKIKKYEREVFKLETAAKQPIPILEYQLTNSEIRDLEARPGRTLEDVGLDEGSVRAAQKLWNFYRLEQSRMESRSIKKIERSQTRALDTLRQIDKALYDRTVAVDDLTLLPYTSSHMRKETAPNPNYTIPDGSIKDVSKEWIM